MAFIEGPAPDGKAIVGYKVTWTAFGRLKDRLFKPERGKGSPLDRALGFSQRLPIGSKPAVVPVLKEIGPLGAFALRARKATT